MRKEHGKQLQLPMVGAAAGSPAHQAGLLTAKASVSSSGERQGTENKHGNAFVTSGS